jgi:hypothetical protein
MAQVTACHKLLWLCNGTSARALEQQPEHSHHWNQEDHAQGPSIEIVPG